MGCLTPVIWKHQYFQVFAFIVDTAHVHLDLDTGDENLTFHYSSMVQYIVWDLRFCDKDQNIYYIKDNNINKTQ